MEEGDLEKISEIIREQFYVSHTSRIDIILLPISGNMGIFYVIYTVEYIDITNIGSVGLEKGLYYYDKEKKILKIQIGKFEKTIPLS